MTSQGIRYRFCRTRSFESLTHLLTGFTVAITPVSVLHFELFWRPDHFFYSLIMLHECQFHRSIERFYRSSRSLLNVIYWQTISSHLRPLLLFCISCISISYLWANCRTQSPIFSDKVLLKHLTSQRRSRVYRIWWLSWDRISPRVSALRSLLRNIFRLLKRQRPAFSNVDGRVMIVLRTYRLC